jgi:hypothetical protein
MQTGSKSGQKEMCLVLYEIGRIKDADEMDWVADYHKENTFRIIYQAQACRKLSFQRVGEYEEDIKLK